MKSGPQDVDADFAELLAFVGSLGDDVSEPQRRGGGSSFSFKRAGCQNFVCITRQVRSVKVETLDESLGFGVTIHVGSRGPSIPDAKPVIRRGYDLGSRRHR